MTIEPDDRDEPQVRRSRMIDEFRQAQIRRRERVSDDAVVPSKECATKADGAEPVQPGGVVITVRRP